MAHTGDGAQAQHHLLVHVKHRDEQQQRPEQRGAVVLPGLRVGAEGTGIVVADHDDQAGAEDGEQRPQTRTPAIPCAGVMVGDGAECTADVTHVGVVERGMTRWCVDARSEMGHIDLRLLVLLDAPRGPTSRCATAG
ncbi:hypothetical protein R38712_05343 [Ralstonia pickettii]|uniref:Uncharacterized protein n=1 Tax=Ralstonia pickettii TaxID=329 RepID=A0ABM9IW71_RALPI|nr:hypothetical protein R38712_05343 [Ralstonia pickettii]